MADQQKLAAQAADRLSSAQLAEFVGKLRRGGFGLMQIHRAENEAWTLVVDGSRFATAPDLRKAEVLAEAWNHACPPFVVLSHGGVKALLKRLPRPKVQLAPVEQIAYVRDALERARHAVSVSIDHDSHADYGSGAEGECDLCRIEAALKIVSPTA